MTNLIKRTVKSTIQYMFGEYLDKELTLDQISISSQGKISVIDISFVGDKINKKLHEKGQYNLPILCKSIFISSLSSTFDMLTTKKTIDMEIDHLEIILGLTASLDDTFSGSGEDVLYLDLSQDLDCDLNSQFPHLQSPHTVIHIINIIQYLLGNVDIKIHNLHLALEPSCKNMDIKHTKDIKDIKHTKDIKVLVVKATSIYMNNIVDILVNDFKLMCTSLIMNIEPYNEMGYIRSSDNKIQILKANKLDININQISTKILVDDITGDLPPSNLALLVSIIHSTSDYPCADDNEESALHTNMPKHKPVKIPIKSKRVVTPPKSTVKDSSIDDDNIDSDGEIFYMACDDIEDKSEHRVVEPHLHISVNNMNFSLQEYTLEVTQLCVNDRYLTSSQLDLYNIHINNKITLQNIYAHYADEDNTKLKVENAYIKLGNLTEGDRLVNEYISLVKSELDASGLISSSTDSSLTSNYLLEINNLDVEYLIPPRISSRLEKILIKYNPQQKLDAAVKKIKLRYDERDIGHIYNINVTSYLNHETEDMNASRNEEYKKYSDASNPESKSWYPFLYDFSPERQGPFKQYMYIHETNTINSPPAIVPQLEYNNFKRQCYKTRKNILKINIKEINVVLLTGDLKTIFNLLPKTQSQNYVTEINIKVLRLNTSIHERVTENSAAKNTYYKQFYNIILADCEYFGTDEYTCLDINAYTVKDETNYVLLVNKYVKDKHFILRKTNNNNTGNNAIIVVIDIKGVTFKCNVGNLWWLTLIDHFRSEFNQDLQEKSDNNPQANNNTPSNNTHPPNNNVQHRIYVNVYDSNILYSSYPCVFYVTDFKYKYTYNDNVSNINTIFNYGKIYIKYRDINTVDTSNINIKNIASKSQAYWNMLGLDDVISVSSLEIDIVNQDVIPHKKIKIGTGEIQIDVKNNISHEIFNTLNDILLSIPSDGNNSLVNNSTDIDTNVIKYIQGCETILGNIPIIDDYVDNPVNSSLLDKSLWKLDINVACIIGNIYNQNKIRLQPHIKVKISNISLSYSNNNKIMVTETEEWNMKLCLGEIHIVDNFNTCGNMVKCENRAMEIGISSTYNTEHTNCYTISVFMEPIQITLHQNTLQFLMDLINTNYSNGSGTSASEIYFDLIIIGKIDVTFTYKPDNFSLVRLIKDKKEIVNMVGVNNIMFNMPQLKIYDVLGTSKLIQLVSERWISTMSSEASKAYLRSINSNIYNMCYNVLILSLSKLIKIANQRKH